MFNFKIIKKDKNTKARLGILKTPHGIIHTPNIAIVATKGSIRGLSFDLAKKFGAEIFMINTFHFFHNERYKIVQKFGGLHKFLNVNYTLMTDSGGFQVFSLGFGLEHGVGKVADIFPLETRINADFNTDKRGLNNTRINADNGLPGFKPNKLPRLKPDIFGNHSSKLSGKYPSNSSGRHPGSNQRKSAVKIFEEGVEFISPYNGKKLFLTPELSIKIQKILKADIIFAFDECTSPLSGYEYTKLAMKRTHSWELRCLEEFYRTRTSADLTRNNADRNNLPGYQPDMSPGLEPDISGKHPGSLSGKHPGKNTKSLRGPALDQVMFGIVQGGEYEDLRKESAKFINSLPFFGFGIGGSLGKSKKDIIKVLNWTLPLLDENKPKHLLGIGEVDDIFNAVEKGIDLFDCVIPTRWARHGAGFTFKGRINLKSSKYLNDKKPIDLECKCKVCKKFSKSYISHLLKENEIYGIMLLTEHNVFWILNLFKEIRKAIKENRFLDLKRKILKYW
jgi:tRNA-guanine family transglycosylase